MVVQAFGFALCLLGAASVAIAVMATGPLVHGSVPRSQFVLLGALMLCIGVGAILRYRSIAAVIALGMIAQVIVWLPDVGRVLTSPFDGLHLFNALFWMAAALIPVLATSLGWRCLR